MDLRFKLAFLRNNRDLFKLSERERLYWFFREQFRFGHREILLDYLGMSYDNLIIGFLQHGFHGDASKPWPYQTLPKNFSSFYPTYVWNKVTEMDALNHGYSHVKAIGSPWLYLLQNIVNSSVEDFGIEKRDVLVVPSHGSGHYHALKDYSLLPTLFRKEIGDCDSSVLLYYTEYCDPDIRLSWEKSGFKVLCNGMGWGPDTRTLWSYNGGRPNFLRNAYRFLTSHDRVLCQSPTAFAVYSASLGVPTKICNSDFSPKTMGIVSAGKGVQRLRDYENRVDQISLTMLGSKFSTYVDLDYKQELSLNALGQAEVKSPETLRSILQLSPGLIPLPE